MKILLVIILSIVLLGGCSEEKNFIGQMDTPIEYSRFTNQAVTEQEHEQLVSFLYEAEMMIQKPIEEAEMINGIKVFPHEFINKNDLFEYYQTYLSNELADTLARKVTDLSRSIDQQYLAVSDDVDWYSIFEAEPSTIKVVLHTTVQSVVEMDLKDPNTRLQYTIMKNRFGENPKIVQKTVLYN